MTMRLYLVDLLKKTPSSVFSSCLIGWSVYIFVCLRISVDHSYAHIIGFFM